MSLAARGGWDEDAELAREAFNGTLSDALKKWNEGEKILGMLVPLESRLGRNSEEVWPSVRSCLTAAIYI